MIALQTLPAYEIRDDDGTIVAETIGYEATRAAVRYLLESGEELGKLTTHLAGRDEVLEAARMNPERSSIVWATYQGRLEGLR